MIFFRATEEHLIEMADHENAGPASAIARKRGLVICLTVLFLMAVSLTHAAARQTLAGHIPVRARSLTPLYNLQTNTQLRLAISLPLRNTNELKQLLLSIYDPASPNFRHYLSAEEFTRQFGPTEADYAVVANFCRKNGMLVAGTHLNRTILDVTAPVRTIETTFHTTLKVYQHPAENRTFYSPTTEPSLDIATRVLHIQGLDSFKRPRPLMKRHALPPDNSIRPNAGSGSGGTYLGRDFRNAYVPGVALTGSGQTLALVEFDGYYLADITNYEKLAGLSAVPLTNVLVDNFNGLPLTDGTYGNEEVALDIQVALGMAPGLKKIMVYESDPNGSAYDILNQIATDNSAKQISCSWTWGTYDVSLDQIFQQYAAQGQSFFQASGDSGAYVGGVDAPADNPYITVVGGTVLTTSSQVTWSGETVWGDTTSIGSGGGSSTLYALPAWQAGLNTGANGGSTTSRNIPDVAMVADNVLSISDNGSTYSMTGTSIAAPLWAAFTALVNQQATNNGQPYVGFLNPALYAIGKGANTLKAFHDITSGNNTTFSSPNSFYAVAGYDLCTGWGTPTGSNTINLLLQYDNSQIDHFGWSAISTNIVTNTPLAVTLTAQSASGITATSFTSAASLSATQWQTNVLFSRDFEAGTLSDWTNLAGPYTTAIDATTAAAGTAQSLTLFGGDGLNSYNGLSHSLTDISPDWVQFYVKAKTNNLTSGYVVAGKTAYRTNSVFHFRMDGTGQMGLTDASGSFYTTAYAANQWYKIAIQIDWGNKVVSYYANDVLVMKNIPFCNPSLTSLALINVYNFDNTQAWWDQFSMVKGVGTAISISGTATSSFTNGAWHGLVNITQRGTNISLSASDNAGHTGTSSFFTADGPVQTGITVVSSPVAAGAVTGGGTFAAGSQQVLTATTNSGWKFTQWQDGVVLNPRTITVPATNITYTATFAQLPAITSQPASLTVNSGDFATFNLTAAGALPLSYAWQRNGISIAKATNTSYTLSPVLTSDSGAVFTCTISNAVGTLTSQSAELTVRPVFSATGIKRTGTTFTGTFSGTPGSNYVVLVSSNLLSWSPLITVQLTNSTFLFSDTNAKSPSLFYRLSSP